MDSASDKRTIGLFFPAVDVFVVDWESMDHSCWRAELLGERAVPFDGPETELPAAPLWQSCEGSGDYWEWLSASQHLSHTDLGWQAERLLHVQKQHGPIHFGAIMGLLDWEDFKMTVCGVLMCMSLADADGVSKQLLLLVKPAGHPKRWDTFEIERLRKCEYQECYRARVIVTESPVFSGDVPLRHMVRKVFEFLPLRSLRLKDVCHGKLSDLSRPSSCMYAVVAGGAMASASLA